MSQFDGSQMMPEQGGPVASLGLDRRSAFLTKTYNHLFGAILLFVGLEILYFQTGFAAMVFNFVAGTSWLLILGAFMLVSWLTSRAAHTTESLGAQYAALIGYVVAWSIMFIPVLYIANYYAPGTITSAGLTTLLGFAGLTAIVLLTRRDFSFLGGILWWLGVVALIAIVGSVLFGFQLGTYFSVAMVAFAGAAILYDTSNVLHHYPEDRYVGAALELFGSVALMFWYILQLFTSRD